MAIEYKRLTEKELNIFINMRINQLREEGAKEEIDLFPALKEYYTHHMKDLALKYVKDEEAAKDVLQEAYIRAWKNLDKLKEPEKFDSWLAQIVVNTAKNELEKRNHTPLDLRMESGEEEDAEIMDQAVSVWENEPELEYTKEETRQLVHELIDALSDEQRLVVIAFELEGLTTKEIAEQLGCPEATVKSRLRYGRNNIKTKAEELQKRGYKLYSVAPMPLLLYLLKKEMVVSAAEPSTQLLLSECRKSIAKSTYGAGKTAASTAVKAAGTARKISFLSTAAGKAVIGIVATASIASAVTVGVISYNKSNDKNATAQENVPAVEEVPVNADQPIDGVVEDTETTDAPEDENGSEKYADIPESVLPSSVRNDKDYFEFWDEPVKATCWIDGVKGTIYADWDKTQIIKEVTYDVDGYEDELLIIGSTLDGGTHAIAIYNGQYVVVNDAMWDHWYNGKSSAFD